MSNILSLSSWPVRPRQLNYIQMVEVEVEDKPSQYLTSQSFQDVDFISSLPLLPRIKLSIFGPDNQTDFIRNIHRKQNQIGSRFFIFIFFLAVTPLVLPNKPGWWWLQASLQWFSGQQWKKFLTFTIHTVQNYRQTCTHLSYFWYLYKIIRLICPVD